MMTITDNGRGFRDNENSNGLGLNSMRERMTAVGGYLQVDGESEQGTRVSAVYPERTKG